MSHTLFYTLVFVLLGSTLSFAQEMTFETTTIDYGTITQGADGERIFEITNTGEVPLLISRASPSCGCSASSFPKQPIAPGEKGVIVVEYDTKRLGYFHKYFTIHSNDKNRPIQKVAIKGDVIAKEVKETVSKLEKTN